MSTQTHSTFTGAEKHLSRACPKLKSIIKRAGPFALEPDSNAFRILSASIVSQQISTKAAESISNRVRALCGRGGIRPKRLIELGDDELRAAGLSRSKVVYMRSLSQFFLDNAGLLRRFRDMPDEDVIEALLPIRGVGEWTAQMFLIFCLGRADVLPTADFGFKAGVRDTYGLDELPKHKELLERAEPWRPFRTVATWYFWRSRGFISGAK
jgi:DNA-3-methyladenine glycosylase II